MKGLRGRILKNLKAIPQVKYIDFSPSSSSRVLQEIPANAPPSPKDERLGAAEGKENTATAAEKRSLGRREEEEEGVSRFRRPDLNSPSLFDPDLLAAFQQAVAEYRRSLQSTFDPWPVFEALEKIPEEGETLERILGGGEVLEETLERGKIPEEGSLDKIPGDEEILEGILEEEGLEKTLEEKGLEKTLEEEDLEKTLEEDSLVKILGRGKILETLEEEVLEKTLEQELVLEQTLEEEEEEERRPSKVRRRNDEERERRNEGVVLYTTSLGGIRKTFEDCNKVRSLLCSLRVVFDERDLAMHLGYREELRSRLGGAAAVPPCLFVGGTLVGGADRVLGLHENGTLLPLLCCAPVDGSGAVCQWCAGARFLLCVECSGSCKVFCEREGGATRCSKCNENGLVVCVPCRSRAAPDYEGECNGSLAQ